MSTRRNEFLPAPIFWFVIGFGILVVVSDPPVWFRNR